jgi:hypothetical protein
VADFADTQVGAVSGELHLRKRQGTSPGGQGGGLYWKYEKAIRANESGAGSTVGATGAIYAIRRHLFQPIPTDTILDDVLIPMQVVRSGYRVVFEADARAHDLMAMNPRDDFIRKTRTIAGTFQLFVRHTWILNPLRCRVWFRVWSHKALRLGVPVLHLMLLTANLALLDQAFYRLMFAGQALFYATAVMGYIQARPERSRRARIERRRAERAQGPARAERQQQVEAQHRRRQHERQRDGGLDHALPARARARQPPGEGRADDEQHGRRDRGQREGESQRREVFAHRAEAGGSA